MRRVADLATASDAALDGDRRRRGGGRASRRPRARARRYARPTPPRSTTPPTSSRTQRIAAAAVRAGVRRFVLASTIKVHGEATVPGRPFRADDPLRPAAMRTRAARPRPSSALAAIARGNLARRRRAAAAARLRAARQGQFPDAARRRRAPRAAAVRPDREPARSPLRRQSRARDRRRCSMRPAPSAARGSPPTAKRSRRPSSCGASRRRSASPRGCSTCRRRSLVARGARRRAAARCCARTVESLEVDASPLVRRIGPPPFTLDQGLAATAAWWRLRHAI